MGERSPHASPKARSLQEPFRRSRLVDRRIAQAVILSVFVPGLAHLVWRRRVVEGTLLLTFTLLWGVLGVVQLATLWAHYPHVDEMAMPGIIAQFLLYGALLPVVGALASVGLAESMRARAH